MCPVGPSILQHFIINKLSRLYERLSSPKNVEGANIVRNYGKQSYIDFIFLLYTIFYVQQIQQSWLYQTQLIYSSPHLII